MDNEAERTIRTLMMRTTPRPLLFFDVEIVEHCNLNCKSCASLSPIAEHEYLNIEEYTRDVNRLSELAEGEMHHINIMGGEPLLHPDVCDFLRITRERFPVGIVFLITNGILLNKMKEDFWNVCREYDITVAPSQYPVNVDYEKAKRKAEERKVKFRLFNKINKYGGWIHTTLDLEGFRNENHSFLHCWQANNCSVLDHGRLYPCPVIPNIRHFNNKFGTNFTVSRRDYIDIYKADSIEEIMKFYCHSVPFCRFCNTFRNYECDWGISKQDIEEWI